MVCKLFIFTAHVHHAGENSNNLQCHFVTTLPAISQFEKYVLECCVQYDNGLVPVFPNKVTMAVIQT